MMTFEMRLSSVPEIEAFVSIATSQNFPVSVSDGMHTVNGKSFFQMFCLQLNDTLFVTAECFEELGVQFENEVRQHLAK